MCCQAASLASCTSRYVHVHAFLPSILTAIYPSSAMVLSITYSSNCFPHSLILLSHILLIFLRFRIFIFRQSESLNKSLMYVLNSFMLLFPHSPSSFSSRCLYILFPKRGGLRKILTSNRTLCPSVIPCTIMTDVASNSSPPSSSSWATPVAIYAAVCLSGIAFWLYTRPDHLESSKVSSALLKDWEQGR
jgi:hypothetical protein